MNTPRIAILRDPGADPDLPLPTYASAGAAGADVRADLGGGTVALAPGKRALIPTGLRLQIPEGWEVQVRPRSGLALNHGITVLNAPGTIDSEYRGPLGVILVNLGTEDFTVAHGDRIAQLVVAHAPQADFAPVETLEDSARGAGGLGSTGRG